MTVRKKGNKWYCRFQIDGIRYERPCKAATDEKSALQCEVIIKSEIMRGHYDFGKTEKAPKLKDAIAIMTTHSENNKRSVRTDKYQFKKVVEFWGENKPLRDITAQNIEEFKSFLKIRKTERVKQYPNPDYPTKSRKKYIKEREEIEVITSNSTINRYVAMLKKMFNLCVKNRLITENPCAGIKMLREPNYKIRYLTDEEQTKLFDAIKDCDFLSLVKVALYTGMRRGEILSLKWENIEDDFIEILDSKSGKSRKIPNVGNLKLLLEKISHDNEYVFYNKQTGTRFYDIKKQFNTAVKNAGIVNFRFHDLRHTAATRMVRAGIDLVVVKELLGHANIQTTMRYAHALQDVKENAIELLSRY